LTAFQQSLSLFQDKVLPELNKSVEYTSYDINLQKTLLIADRILAACEGDINHGRIAKEIPEMLAALRDGNTANSQFIASNELLGKIEIWYKSILWLALPDKWKKATDNSHAEKKSNNNSFYNLHQVIELLELLSESENSSTVVDQLQDPVRQYILNSKEDRNLDTHSPELGDHSVQSRINQSVPIAFLAPVIRYREVLETNLRQLATHPINFGRRSFLALQVESERMSHINRFRAREDLLNTLVDKLHTDFVAEGGYVLLSASQGVGKSAVASILSDRMGTGNKLLGAHVTDFRKHAPWLTGVILHFGKQSNQPSEIVPFLLEQIRVQLVSTPPPYDQLFPDDDISLDTIAEPVSLLPSDATDWKPDQELTSSDDDQTAKGYQTTNNDALLDRKQNVLMHARRLLYDYLNRLVSEKGQVTLIIDALEEISDDGSRLAFLPERLPAGVACLLTSRSQSTASEFVLSKLTNVHEVELKLLSRSEIPFLTGICDDTPKGKKTNDEVMRSSDGLPLIIPNSLNSNDISKSRDAHFKSKAQEWQTNSPILDHLLGLLVFFEPIGPLDINDIQGFLASQDINMEASGIRDAMDLVKTQVQGVSTGRIKLAMRPLAEFVREHHFSKRDLFNRFKTIIEWLLEDSEASTDLFTRLFVFWADTSKRELNQLQLSKAHLDYIHHLPKILFEKKKGELLHETALYVLKNICETHKIVIECWRFACQLGYERSMISFSYLLGLDNVSNEIKDEAIKWLVQAADKHNDFAMFILGVRLLHGHGIDADINKGRALLENAAIAGDKNAMFRYGMELIRGNAIAENTDEGLTWIQKAAEAKLPEAKVVLADRLIDAIDGEVNIQKAIEHLLDAAEAGDISALKRLSYLYFDGLHVPIDSERAIEFLTTAAEKGSESATVKSAQRFLYGNGIQQNIERGISILENGIADGMISAKRQLAYELLLGDITDISDNVRGISLLQELISEGDTSSTELLAGYYIDETEDQQQTGQSMLEEAATVDKSAAIELASRLCGGVGLPPDKQHAIRILEHSADQGHEEPMLFLGIEQITGNLLPKNTKVGVDWIDKLISKGNNIAKLRYGQLLLNGKHLPKNTALAMTYLTEASNAGYSSASRQIALHLLGDNTTDTERDNGIAHLELAAQQGSHIANYELGKRYQDGDGVTPNSTKASHYLKRAARDGSQDALMWLGKCKLLGLHSKKDEKCGMALLNRAGDLEPDCLNKVGTEFFEEQYYQWAAWCFLQFYNHTRDGNNLAYILRQQLSPVEIDADVIYIRTDSHRYRMPHVRALLKRGLARQCNFCIVNHALCFAQGFQVKENWDLARDIVAKVSVNQSDEEDLMKWWHNLTGVDDDHAAEGHLVVGWLVKIHGLVDPDNMPYQERFKLAVKGGWNVPDDIAS